MEHKPAVGVIGIGQMGMGVAMTLLRKGFPVRVRDLRREAEDEARAAGATTCATPAELARGCAVIITLVVNAEQTDSVMFGADGALAGLARGGVVMMSSTVAPSYAQGLALRLGERGVLLLDAPVSGGPARAHAGTMSMMLAGEAAAMDQCRPVLEAIADKRFHIGERAGDGSKAKIVNNMLAGVNLAAACEAMALAIKLGLDPRAIAEVVSASSGASWMFSDRMPRVLAGDYAPRAALEILTKDLSILLDAARELNFPANIAQAAHQAYVDAVALGHGAEDDAALIKLYQTLAGIELPQR
jgi:L-threonate 2-dehydrogenase